MSEEIKDVTEETTGQGVQLVFIRKKTKHDQNKVEKLNAMVVDGTITFGPDQQEERELFQKILDENGIVFNDFKIVPLDEPKLPEEILNKEIKFSSDEEVIAEIQKIQDNCEDNQKLARLVALSKLCKHTMCLTLKNTVRISLEESLEKETDKAKRRHINALIRKTPKKISYCIRDGYFLQMNANESKDNAARRLYDEICQGTAKSLDIKPKA